MTVEVPVDITSPERLLAVLLTRDLTTLLPLLGADAERRLIAGNLTVAEWVVAALWAGVDPIRIWLDC
ncbi:hypothetical protein [Nocardia sp. NPDC059236]|uniref:hypothetical protein n=1 Tax=Nocardia sp. NPDC059236 TaxID=3346783 RepID=UPI003689F6DC